MTSVRLCSLLPLLSHPHSVNLQVREGSPACQSRFLPAAGVKKQTRKNMSPPLGVSCGSSSALAQLLLTKRLNVVIHPFKRRRGTRV